MKILIDLQGCQSASRFRGMGRYSLALAKALIRNGAEHQFTLLLNGLYADGLDQLKAQFSELVNPDEILVFDAIGPVAEFDPANAARARVAELARERLIRTINPDAVFLTSLFEGFVDDAITSAGLFENGPFTAITLYDLIPFLNPDPKWPENYKDYYRLKIDSLKRADLLLSISKHAKHECEGALPELSGRIVNMSSACDDIFRPKQADAGELASLLSKFDVVQPFVMSAGSLEPRKNFVQLILAFAELPVALRASRQIVLVGTADTHSIDEIKQVAVKAGLLANQLHVLGHVTDEELHQLYCACELFVFPSLHEGFGLPPLEAMASGAVVLGSNATSVPEVIGRHEAMFDPHSVSELSELMHRALTDFAFRERLRADGLRQAATFSWDRTAQQALSAIEAGVQLRSASSIESAPIAMKETRPRVAIVSPLPPERTGIADYVAELLPSLGMQYDLTIVSDQAETSLSSESPLVTLRSIAWFEEHAETFDRIVYQMGNSPFHAHMPRLMKRYPGVVVLHDFFISALMIWMEVSGYKPLSLNDTLCRSHGYTALDFLGREGVQATKLRWPFSYDVVSSALNVVVHSEYARELIIKYYGEHFAAKTHLVRQHRVTVQHNECVDAREKLQLKADDFVVCAFGFMDYTKLNHMLLEAWGRSTLSRDRRCHLIFVGGEPDPLYNERIQAMLDELNAQHEQPIKITGFADHETFAEYLSVVDIAVQLRTLSRGETSRTVLDCLAHGVPLIVNANGAMAEYPDEVLVKLPDDFKVDQLVDALESLREDALLRAELGRRGMDYIRHEHDPERTTAAYAAAIEEVAGAPALQSMKRTAMRFSRSNAANPPADVDVLSDLAIDLIFEPRRPRIYLDISATARNDLRTGIERAARSLLRELLHSPPAGHVIVPVYLNQENGVWRVRKAHKYLSSQDGFSLVTPQDDLVIPLPGDTLFALDLFSDGVTQACRQGLYRYWRASGAKIGFMVYDLLPISHPEFFPPWSFEAHRAWTEVVASRSDLAVCISKHVKSEFERWMDENPSIVALNTPQVFASALGADMTASFPTSGLPPDAEQVLQRFAGHPTFLMVGTIEPRKGYLQAILAFEKLWASGIDVNLVIVGYEGWKPLVPEDRRTIPAIIEAIRACPELNKRLFWLEGISDEYLSRVYAASSCLLATSEGEGYGLPLIEAAQHNLPVIARDLDVFREVAGDAAYYFSGTTPEDLEVAIGRWLDLRINSETPDPSDLRWETWAHSAHRLGEILARQVHAEANSDVARDAKCGT